MIKFFKKKFKMFLDDEKGIGSIELVLILLVLVGLIVIFRENILDLIDTIFDKITTQLESF